MLDAVRAEALKLRRHRATWLMVWIYPVGIALLLAGTLLYGLVSTSEAAEPMQTAEDWLRSSTILWSIPASPPGRFLIAGFTALVFAGEYGWNTWKLIIPARARWQLIAAKWLVAIGFVVLALAAADLIALIGQWLHSLQGDPVPAGVTLGAIAETHLVAAGHALLPIIYTVVFAGLFAILTQSILATVILSIALVVIEGLWPLIGIFAYGYAPALTVGLFKALPIYHMANLIAWSRGAGQVVPLGPDTLVALSWGSSFAVLVGWIFAAAAFTLLRFQRQDLN